MTRNTNTRAIASWLAILQFYAGKGITGRHQADLRDSALAAAGRPSTVCQPPRPCYAVHPLVNRPVRSPLLAQHPPFRAVQPGKQQQNRAGPDNSHHKYQCDRFLGAHMAILCLGACQGSKARHYSCRLRFFSATLLMRRTARLRTSRGHRPVPPARQGGRHRSARQPVRAGCPAASAPKPRRGHREGRPG